MEVEHKTAQRKQVEPFVFAFLEIVEFHLPNSSSLTETKRSQKLDMKKEMEFIRTQENLKYN